MQVEDIWDETERVRPVIDDLEEIEDSSESEQINPA
jgi:hypothetical protein